MAKLLNGKTSQAPLRAAFSGLEAQCPERVEFDRWLQVVEDGKAFLREWGERAEALGWKANDLFGLAPIPAAAPIFQRLSRYDRMGLCWLLRGRKVVALSKTSASIQTANGTMTYRRP